MSGQHRAIREKPEKSPEEERASIRERIREWFKHAPLPEPPDTCPTCGQVIPELASPASYMA